MKKYKFSLSKLAILGCIGGILLGFLGIGMTIYRILNSGFSTPSLIIQHVLVLLVSVLALLVFSSILIRSVYILTDDNLILWFGIIKSIYKISEIESVHLFTKTNKLVVYFKGERYTVIVVKPNWFHEFTQELLKRNEKIRYDVSTTDSNDMDEI